jgi:hypothetical protein
LCITLPSHAVAQGKLGIAKEVVEQLAKKFSKEVSEEGVEKLTV